MRLLYPIVGLTLIPLISCNESKQEPKQDFPNIVYVFPDQMRNHAMEFWGEESFSEAVNFKPDPVITPNLNEFARESAVFTNALSNCPLSGPHRGMLFTGMYPQDNGVSLNPNSLRPISSLREDVTAWSDVFSQENYSCGYIGKLHLDFPTPTDPENPGHYVENQKPVWDTYTPLERRHGFDYWYSYGTFDEHKNPHYWDKDGKKHEPKEWSPKHEADMAISYLKNDSKQRDPNKPFFLVVSMNPPHSPYRSLEDAMEEDYNLYKDKSKSELLIRPNADTTMTKAASAPYYFANVTGVDREFGRILDALKELGLDENTIVIFSSDHGETMCSQGVQDPKNSVYTESLNVPFLIRYPNKIKPKIVDGLFSTVDIMPTLLGAANLKSKIPSSVQGKDYSDALLLDDSSTQFDNGVLYIRNVNGDTDKEGIVTSYFPQSRGIKTKDYTLALSINGKNNELTEVLFFNDKEDPYQLNNLTLEDLPEQKEALLAQLGTLLKETNDPWYKDKILSEMIPY